MNKIFTVINAVILFAVIAGAAALYQWFNPQTVTVPVKEYVEVPVEKVVTKIKRVNVPGPKEIVTIEKEKIVKVLDLPDWIKNDPNKQVIANGEVQPYKGKTSVVTVIDTVSGEATMQMKPKPLPFAEFLNEKSIGIGYGFSAKHGRIVVVSGQWGFGRVMGSQGQVYVEGSHAADGESDARILGKVIYIFD